MTVADAIPGHLRSLSIVRTYDAPRALVWKMWTDPAHVAAWWGPEHFTTPVVRMDVRPGGDIHMVMRAPNGIGMPFSGRFVEIDEPQRLVMRTWVQHPDGTTWFEVENTLRFEEVGDRTVQTLHARVLTADESALGPLGGMEAGWSQSLDKLEREIVTTTQG